MSMEDDAQLSGNQNTITPFDFDFNQLDDKEFDIPSVENLPTLESILNEPDNDSILDDEDLPELSVNSMDTSSSSSLDSHSAYGLDKRPKNNLHKDKSNLNIHGSVLRPSKLKNISSQILSAADRVDAGMPTAMAVSQLIGIGTSHGLILVFDPKQVLRWCLGSTAVGAQYGAVSALSFNIDCTRLLSAFAKGQITMWDLTSGKLIRTITDAHPIGSAVLHVKFTDSHVLAVCSDSSGSVFELEFKRLIGVRTSESRCLFSGSRGEVCVIEPLHMNYTIKDHPMQEVTVLAMASLSKVLLVTLRPQLKVMFSHALKGSPSTLPLLAWQFVIIQVSEVDRVIDPVLAMARNSTILFYQVICRGADDIICQGLQKITVSYALLSIKWMNARTLVTLDTTEKVHVLDVRSEEELEVIDISDIQLVYGSSHFKSLATGGNVSQAMAYAGEQSCYQSLDTFGGQLFILGTQSIHVLTLRTWHERIDVLVKQNKYRQALALAQSFYDGRAKAVVGLIGSNKKRKDLVSQLMLDILFEFVNLSMTQLCPARGKIEELEKHYGNVVPVCVDYCLHLDKIDILFGRIYERFSQDVIAHGTFLECLEPYIINDKLTAIPPVIMKDFISLFENRGLLENIEACIVHLDVSSLDIHQIVNLCWKHDLHDAIIYVYNHGMHEYITPLSQLLLCLRSAVTSGIQLTDKQIKLGNKLLVYISCCLAGRAYPLGEIPAEYVSSVKTKIFSLLNSQHATNGNTDETPYSHLRTLLKFDTREFLNVIALAFEEEDFNTDSGILRRQQLVDTLLKVMVEIPGFTPEQIGMLFTFLARQMSRHRNVVVSRSLFEQVLEFLSNPENESRHEEREQALLELLRAGGLQQFDEERLIYLANNAKFYHVCELLHSKRREYNKMLLCYIKDTSRQHRAFNFIREIFSSDSFADHEKSSVYKEAMDNLEVLVKISCEEMAALVIEHFSKNLIEIIHKLQTEPRILLDFLRGVLQHWELSGSAVHPERQTQIDPEVFEEYIDLLCRYSPSDVGSYIKRTDGYRLEQTLQICRHHRISDATSYLLEKAGDIQGAFRIMLENLKSKLRSFQELVNTQRESSANQQEIQISYESVQTNLLLVIQLCQRNSDRLDDAGREALWFPLLEAMMSPQRKRKEDIPKEILNGFRELTHHVLTSMMGFIGLPSILQKIMQDPAYNVGKFGEIKELILGMLETYNYEETLMETCKTLMYQDLHSYLVTYVKTAKRGFIPQSSHCQICYKKLISPSNENILIFRCGHNLHSDCLQNMESVRKIGGKEIRLCSVCNKSLTSSNLSMGHRGQYIDPSSSTATSPQISASTSPSKQIMEDMPSMEKFDHFRKSIKVQSRLQILVQLSKSDSQVRNSFTSANSILQNDKFRLRLTPAPYINSDT